MMAALRASRLVCSATSSMTSTMLPISPMRRPSCSITVEAVRLESLMRSMPTMVFWIDSMPVSASFDTCSDSRAVS